MNLDNYVDINIKDFHNLKMNFGGKGVDFAMMEEIDSPREGYKIGLLLEQYLQSEVNMFDDLEVEKQRLVVKGLTSVNKVITYKFNNNFYSLEADQQEYISNKFVEHTTLLAKSIGDDVVSYIKRKADI